MSQDGEGRWTKGAMHPYFLRALSCDSDVTGTRIIRSRINIYTAITEHSFSYTFTFPTAVPVKWQYEWHGHLRPESSTHTHTNDIPRRNSYHAIFIRLTSSYYKSAHSSLYKQSQFIVKTVQHPQACPVGTEPISSEPLAHTVIKCFKRLRINIKKKHSIACMFFM